MYKITLPESFLTDTETGDNRKSETRANFAGFWCPKRRFHSLIRFVSEEVSTRSQQSWFGFFYARLSGRQANDRYFARCRSCQKSIEINSRLFIGLNPGGMRPLHRTWGVRGVIHPGKSMLISRSKVMVDKIVGHKTFRNSDGSFRHEPLTASEGRRIWDENERKEQERAEKMPDEQSAIKQLFEAYIRLKELGWNNAIYCPKDGSMFSAIEAGSTGIHKCNYVGEWPDGSWDIYDGDVWSAHPILWRPREDTDPDVNHGPCAMGLDVINDRRKDSDNDN